MRNLSTCLFALATALAIPSFAHADDLFTVKDLNNNTSVSFTLPSSPTPAFSDNGEYFYFYVPVNEGGTVVQDKFEFYAIGLPGALSNGGAFTDQYYVGQELDHGDQLYLGSEASPTFKIGTFGASDTYGATTNDYSITISPTLASTTPEPSSIALLGTGLLGVVGVARRRFNR